MATITIWSNEGWQNNHCRHTICIIFDWKWTLRWTANRSVKHFLKLAVITSPSIALIVMSVMIYLFLRCFGLHSNLEGVEREDTLSQYQLIHFSISSGTWYVNIKLPFLFEVYFLNTSSLHFYSACFSFFCLEWKQMVIPVLTEKIMYSNCFSRVRPLIRMWWLHGLEATQEKEWWCPS